MRNHIILLWIAIVLLASSSLFAVVKGVQAHKDIQNSRLASCRDTNERHANAVAYIQHIVNLQVAAAVKKGTPRAQAEAAEKTGQKEFDHLIQTLAPLRNCAAAVNNQ